MGKAGCADLLCYGWCGSTYGHLSRVLLFITVPWEQWCWMARSTYVVDMMETHPSTPWSPILQKQTSKSSSGPTAYPSVCC